MEINSRIFVTAKGNVEGVHVKWPGFGILFVYGSKGFLACGAFDIEAVEKFGAAACLVESTPENPIGTLDRFPLRKVTKVNHRAQALGIEAGMAVPEAFEKIA